MDKRPAFGDRLTVAAVDTFALRTDHAGGPVMALGAMATRPALLVRLTDTHGAEGWGEVWANFPPRANLHKAHLIEDVVAPHVVGVTFRDPAELSERLRAALSTYFLHVGQERVLEHILAGLDMAAWDLALRSAGRSFAQHMGLTAASAPCYASSINAGDLDRLLPAHAALGQTAFKLKIGRDDAADVAFVARAANRLPPGGRLMVDANQSWDATRAHRMLQALQPFDLLFAEEPIRADAPLRDWERLARASSVPLAAGENVYGLDAFLAIAAAGVSVLQPDVAKWGGVSGALALAARLREHKAVWPHFMGTAVGQQAALCVTAAVGASVCEMDVNANPLRTDLCGDVLTIEGGRVGLPGAPGLVVPPAAERLRAHAEAA